MKRMTVKACLPFILGLGLALFLIGIPIILGMGPSFAQAAGHIRYVAPGGTDGSNPCTDSNLPCATIQHAVDVASPGDEIRIVAGKYTDTILRGEFTQTVYLDKPLTLKGGYTPGNWHTPFPQTQPVILDAQGQEGVLVISGTSQVVVEGLHITGGTRGGIGILNATATLNRNVITNTGYGVAIFESHGILSHNLIQDNNVGVYLDQSSGRLDHNTIANNTNTSFGSGVLLFASDNVVLSDNLIEENECNGSSDGDICMGGGVYVVGGENIVLNDNIIRRNQVMASDPTYQPSGGGGVAIYHTAVWLHRNRIVSNIAGDYGGGLSVYYDTQVTLVENIIAGNEADAGGGIALYSGGTTMATLDKDILVDNRARAGGGIWIDYNNQTMLNRTTIQNNQAQNFGGGLFIADETRLTNTIIADNQVEGVGSGLYIDDGPVSLLHTTIARNRGGDGSGIYVMANASPSNRVALTNTILVSHTVGITTAAGSTVTLEGTLWGSGSWANQTDWAGAGNIITGSLNIWDDPAFLTLPAGDYRLSPTSAALNKGIDAGVAEDIDGELRPYGSGFDLGADEGQPALVVTKEASSTPIPAGGVLTYTIKVTNTGYMDLTATITDLLPDQVTPTGAYSWSAQIPAAGGGWSVQVPVTVPQGFVGTLVNEVQVATEEGATGSYTHTLTIDYLYYLPLIFRSQ